MIDILYCPDHGLTKTIVAAGVCGKGKHFHGDGVEVDCVLVQNVDEPNLAGRFPGNAKDGTPIADNVAWFAHLGQYLPVPPYASPLALATAKAMHVGGLKTDATKYIAKHYREPVQRALAALLDEARKTGLVNRETYIQAVLDWVKSVISDVHVKEDSINSKTTVADVEAVTWDFPASFDATDPLKTIRGALAIVN